MVSEEGKADLLRGSPGESSIGGFSRKFDPNDPCTYSTVRKYKCFLDASDASDASGAPVNKCERTEQLLRRCPGRPVEVVESETEYTQGDAVNGSASFWGKENDTALPFPGQPRGSEQQPWSTVPKPSVEPDWPRGSRQRDQLRSAPVPGTFSGFGGIMDAIEDVVRETEDMAHSFLHVFGLDGDDTNKSENPFDRWFGGDMFGGTERRAPRRSEDDASTRPTSKPDILDPKDFREV